MSTDAQYVGSTPIPSTIWQVPLKGATRLEPEGDRKVRRSIRLLAANSMAKKSRRSRLADIRIPDELKKRAVCACCGKYIGGTHSDPVISAPSLGKGAYHYECAMLTWKFLKENDDDAGEYEDS